MFGNCSPGGKTLTGALPYMEERILSVTLVTWWCRAHSGAFGPAQSDEASTGATSPLRSECPEQGFSFSTVTSFRMDS